MTDERLDPDALGELGTTEGTVLAGITIDDSPGPARRISQAQAAALIDAALDGWTGAATVAAPRPRARMRLATIAAIAAALAASTALAWYVATTGSEGEATVVLPPATPPVAPPESTPPPPEEITIPVIVAPVEEPGSATETAPIDEPAADEPARERRRAARSSAPDDLLREANELRAARRWADAEQLYTRVARQSAPTTSAGYVALVAAGGLRLDHLGDPRGALAAYRSARTAQPHGVLDVEARAGIARAYRRLGDRAHEIAALRELIAAYPDEPAAERARSRLAELEAE